MKDEWAYGRGWQIMLYKWSKMIFKLKKRLIIWNIWKKGNVSLTKWQKVCVLLGKRHSLTFEFCMGLFDIDENKKENI